MSADLSENEIWDWCAGLTNEVKNTNGKKEDGRTMRNREREETTWVDLQKRGKFSGTVTHVFQSYKNARLNYKKIHTFDISHLNKQILRFTTRWGYRYTDAYSFSHSHRKREEVC